MKIESYSFGKIKIDGKVYKSDVIVYPDRVNSSWWRKEGHRLQMEDLKEVMKEKPDLLVIGTGSFGVMKVPKGTERALEDAGIDLIIEKTGRAVDAYNRESTGRKTVGAFHLTC